MKRAALLVAITLGLAGASAAASADPAPAAVGLWLSQSQGWVVETTPCDDGVCGYLVAFRETKSADYVARDSQNPDPKKRDTPLCGLKLLGGFTPSKLVAAKWEHGWVYDPDTGSTYTGEAQLVDADTIKLRGYLIIPLFGRTLTLIRQAGAITRCSVPASDPANESAANRAGAVEVVEAGFPAVQRR